MPAKYEAIKRKMKAEGKSDKEAKASAAAIYNSQRKPGQAPVSRRHHRVAR